VGAPRSGALGVPLQAASNNKAGKMRMPEC
jgi:hypothetical protein